MSNADIRGRFVWHELMTTDMKGAAAFYPKVTSWKTQAWDKDPSYTLWTGAKGPFGGLRALPDAARGAGSHWLPYIGTGDVDATVQAAQSLGGRINMGATDIPGAGRFAVLADPQGAVFAIYSPSPATDSGGGGSMPQEFSWHELTTPDPVTALRFYGELFGWAEVRAHDMGPMGLYRLVGLAGTEFMGMYKPDKPMPAAWLSYAQVTDIDKAANAAKAAGGKLLNGPMEVPGGTWIAHITDPQGAPIALHASKRAAVATPAAQPAKAAAPKNLATPATPKREPAVEKPATSASPSAAQAPKPAAPVAVSQAAKKPAATKAAAKKAPAKKAAKKAPAKKPAAKKKGAARKASAKKRPQRRSKAKAKKGARRSAGKKRAGKKRGKSARRRAQAGSFAAARRFAAKQADSLLKRLRGKKHR